MNIIKKGNLHYLSHSFRKDGIVVNRKRYLGKEIPVHIEELKEKFMEQCFYEDVLLKLKKIQKNHAKEWKSLPESIKKKRLVQLSVDFTYNSNAIEGSTITKDETENIIERHLAPAKSITDIQETIAHSKAFFQVLQEKKDLSEALLLQWHYTLFAETKSDIAGKYREYLVRVGAYRAPDWQDVPALMKKLLYFYHAQKKTRHPLLLAAQMHYEFEKIHPFGDGNGRVGRLLIAYILYKNNFPLIFIEVKKRKAYYHALEKERIGFVQYFLRLYLRMNKEGL